MRTTAVAAAVGFVAGLALPALTAGPAFAGSVRVGPGETLSGVAQRSGTTAAALAAANHLANPNLVRPGEILQLPVSTSGTGTNAAGLPPRLRAHPDRLALRPLFVQAATTYGVPVGLLEALCWWESGWQPSLVSATGAIGVCQVEPSTANFVDKVLLPGRGVDVHTAAGNIAAGAAFLHQLLQHTGGNPALAVAGYYQGLGSVEHRGMLPATRQYVRGILAYSSIFASAAS